jgi:pimeloyl-ACP methyl ester carboxylesterase
MVVRGLASLALAAFVAALAASGPPVHAGSARSGWDGCTARAGDLRFRASDGTRLVGHRFGHGQTAVVLAHMTPGDMCQWAPYARRLAKLGYLALAIDLRNHGQSQRRAIGADRGYGMDVAAGAKLVRRLGARKVFLIGASIGGSAVLAGGTRTGVDGVVSVSGAADLADAIDLVPQLHAPVLFLAGRFDVDFANDAKRLYDATGSADKTLKILNRGEHGTQLVGSSPAARRLIEGFIRSD